MDTFTGNQDVDKTIIASLSWHEVQSLWYVNTITQNLCHTILHHKIQTVKQKVDDTMYHIKHSYKSFILSNRLMSYYYHLLKQFNINSYCYNRHILVNTTITCTSCYADYIYIIQIENPPDSPNIIFYLNDINIKNFLFHVYFDTGIYD